MPIIDGIKMACVPCIRGHRSTKCNHANERVMVPVRKPGRPLSVCPHPSNRPCGCGVTAAIPKKPSCPCSSTTGAPAPGPGSCTSSSKNHAPSQQPVNIQDANSHIGLKNSISSGLSNRIQKTQAPKNIRKHSFDPSMLHRVDVSQTNVVPIITMAFDHSHTNEDHQVLSSLNGSMGGFSIKPSLQQSNEPEFAVAMQNSIHMPTISMPTYATSLAATYLNNMAQAQLHTQSPLHTTRSFLPTSAAGSHHAKMKAKRVGLDQNGMLGNANGTMLEQPSTSKLDSPPKKSCCGSSTTEGKTVTTTAPETSELTMKISDPINDSNLYMPFAYPPQIGSQMQPLNPDQWKTFMDAYNMGAASVLMGQPAASFTNINGLPHAQQQTIQPPQTPQQNHSVAPGLRQPQGPPPSGVEPCTCGSDCQCLGCWWHPYNQTTTDQVMSAYNAMFDESVFDDPSLSPLAVETHNIVPAASTPTTKPTEKLARPPCCGRDEKKEAPVPAPAPEPEPEHPKAGNCCAPKSGTVNQSASVVESPNMSVTPSDGSEAMEELTLPGDTYLFVHYPIHGIPCIGDTVTCPCGDDCKCLGCVVHGN